MRIFALSDIHVVYDSNAHEVENLPTSDHHDHALILAGDVSDRLSVLGTCLRIFAKRFEVALPAPGNHDLWTLCDAPDETSLDKFRDVAAVSAEAGVSMQPFGRGALSIVPMFGWYAYSSSAASQALRAACTAFLACRSPNGFHALEISPHFRSLNQIQMSEGAGRAITVHHTCDADRPAAAPLSTKLRMLFSVL